MMNRSRPMPPPIVVTSAMLALLALASLMTVTSPSTADTLEAGDGRQWYRGNLHTHSHWSDGDDYLEMIADWYRKKNYDFLLFTDHNVLANTEKWVTVEKTKGGRKAYDKLKSRFPDWVEERVEGDALQVRLRRFNEVAERFNVPGEFLLIQGEEISDKFGRYPIHLNAGNVVELIPPLGGGSVAETIQNNVDAVLAQRERTGQAMMVHLNHPNFGYAVTAEDLMRIQGERFFEVYNGHPGVHNTGDDHHASTERLWDVVLAHRLGVLGLPVMYGLAVDDGHNYHNIPSRASEPGRGWVQVLATELTAEFLIEALEAGKFYASSGVELKSVTSSNEGLSVEIDPAGDEEYTIEFVGTRSGFDRHHEPVTDEDGKEIRATHRYSDDVGEVFATVRGLRGSYAFNGDELYVRARITSSAEHANPSEPGDFKQAWCQPVVGPAVRAGNSE
jgi:hypothetical protein